MTKTLPSIFSDSLRFWKVLSKSEKWYEFLDHRPVDGWATYFLAQQLQNHINYRDDEIWNKPSTKVMPTNPCSRCNQRSFPWIHSIPWLSDAFCVGRCQCIESIESQVDLLHNTLESICTLKVYANKMVKYGNHLSQPSKSKTMQNIDLKSKYLARVSLYSPYGMRERYRMPSRMPQCVNSLPKMDKASRSLRSQTGRARSWCLRSGDKSRWSPKDFGNGLWDSKWTGISPAQLVPKLISKSQHLHHHVDFYFWPWTSNSLKDGKNGTPKYPNSLLLRKLEDLLWVLPLLNHQVGPQCVRELVTHGVNSDEAFLQILQILEWH